MPAPGPAILNSTAAATLEHRPLALALLNPPELRYHCHHRHHRHRRRQSEIVYPLSWRLKLFAFTMLHFVAVSVMALSSGLAPGFHNKPYPPGHIHSTLPLLEALAKWPPPAPSAKSIPLNLRFFTRGALLAFGPPAWQLALPAFLPPHPSQVPGPWQLLMIEQWYWQGYNDFWVQFDTIVQLQGYAAACAWSNSLAAACG